MRQLSPAGQQVLADLAQRHGFSTEAALVMLDAVIAGNGGMAQFNHFEFGGAGQWMRGGMIMIGDMFNSYLKGRIDTLCTELAELVANQPDLIRSGSFQSQSQGGQAQSSQYQGGQQQGGQQQGGYAQPSGFGGGQQQQNQNGPSGPVSLFVPAAPGQSQYWWPTELGWPDSTGAQNQVRYAYFQYDHRLAIDLGGTVTVYDTLDHQIGGFSQQQSGSGSLSFSSQYGLVNVAELPVVTIRAPGLPAQIPAFPPAPQASFAPAQLPPTPEPSSSAPSSSAPSPPTTTSPAGIGTTDVFATIDKLAELHGRGILTDEEFSTKKAELLSRL